MKMNGIEQIIMITGACCYRAEITEVASIIEIKNRLKICEQALLAHEVKILDHLLNSYSDRPLGGYYYYRADYPLPDEDKQSLAVALKERAEAVAANDFCEAMTLHTIISNYRAAVHKLLL